MRTAEFARKTKETDIRLTLCIDGSGRTELATGVGFFDHMLDALCRFAQFDLTLNCAGDLQVDAHHTVEDVGIRRVGSAYMPMDEALAFAAIDVSGRPYLAWNAEFTAPMCGTMDTQLAEEFFRAVTVNAGLTVHMNLIAGRNDHHKMEALFKAFGLALRDAVRVDANIQGVLSTKGTLD